MEAFLEENARRFGFTYTVQRTAEVAAHLHAEGDAYTARVLTETERNLFRTLRVQKRRVEWLAGRIAAKRAFARYRQALGDAGGNDTVSVLNRPSRAPYFMEHPDVRISISHSHEYAVAVVAGFALGVDIEKTEPRPRAIAAYFFCPAEQHLLDHESRLPADEDVLITLLWSRKEAVSKYLQRGGGVDFRAVNAVPDRIRVEGISPEWIRLLSGCSAGYCVSLALAGGDDP